MIDYNKKGQIKAEIDRTIDMVKTDPASWLEYAEWVGGPVMVHSVKEAIAEGGGNVYEAASQVHWQFICESTNVTPQRYSSATTYFLWVLLARLCDLGLNRANEPLPSWLAREIKTWK